MKVLGAMHGADFGEKETETVKDKKKRHNEINKKAARQLMMFGGTI